jgi:hypothetical protein
MVPSRVGNALPQLPKRACFAVAHFWVQKPKFIHKSWPVFIVGISSWYGAQDLYRNLGKRTIFQPSYQQFCEGS